MCNGPSAPPRVVCLSALCLVIPLFTWSKEGLAGWIEALLDAQHLVFVCCNLAAPFWSSVYFSRPLWTRGLGAWEGLRVLIM